MPALKGPYFAIAMLGLNEVLRALVSYFEGLTGGGFGLSLPTLRRRSRSTTRWR
jgi:ABC-type branched-subunit amino acid transport system permease subunit